MGVQRVNLADDSLSRMQDNLATAIDAINKVVISKGVLLTGVVLKTGQVNDVPHTLGRIPLAFLDAGKNSNSVIWTSPSPAPSTILRLNCSANTTASLYIF